LFEWQVGGMDLFDGSWSEFVDDSTEENPVLEERREGTGGVKLFAQHLSNPLSSIDT